MEPCPCCGASCPIRTATNGNVYVCWDCLVEWNGVRSKKRSVKKHGDSPLAGLGLCA